MNKLALAFLGTVWVLVGCSKTEPSVPEPNENSLKHPDGVIAATVVLPERPFGVAVSRSGIAIASRLDAAAVTSFTVASSTRALDVPVGQVPTDVAFAPSGTTAYVTNQFSGTIGVIDVAANQQVAAITVQGDPFRVIVNSDGSRVIASSNADMVFVIDAARREVVASIQVCADPNGLALAKDGTTLFVACPTDGRLATVNLATKTVTRTVETQVAVQEILLSPDEAEVYVASLGGGLLIRRASDLSPIATIAAVPSSFGMAVSPDGAQLYATETLSGAVAIVDRKERRRIGTILTGGAPRRVAFTRLGESAVVADESGKVVFIR